MGICLEDLAFDFAPAKLVWKPIIKRLLAGSWSALVLRPKSVQYPSRLKRLGLYLHVPFCRDLCPYCPYNRFEYTAESFATYEKAVHQEIDIYGDARDAAGSSPEVVSLYVGGGTPTVEPAALGRLIGHITARFGTPADVCVELHPGAMDDECLGVLKRVGVTMLSVGVESLNDRLLALIGRSHDATTASDAVRRAMDIGFDSVNVDLMFALPTQTLDELDDDIRQVLSFGVDQVSTYPIFGFPYTELGERLGIRAIRRPPGALVRKMLSLIRRRCLGAGFKQCAVWSFLRPGEKKFSSITRHHYIGFGPSAASMTGQQFYVNTFDVDEYASALPERLPVALVLLMNRRLEMAYWLYWRAYEMKAVEADFSDLFCEGLTDTYGWVLAMPRLLGMVGRRNGSFVVNEKGAYWLHRIQNEYSLNYINRLWGTCRGTPWPKEVVF